MIKYCRKKGTKEITHKLYHTKFCFCDFEEVANDINVATKDDVKLPEVGKRYRKKIKKIGCVTNVYEIIEIDLKKDRCKMWAGKSHFYNDREDKLYNFTVYSDFYNIWEELPNQKVIYNIHGYFEELPEDNKALNITT